MYNIPKSIVPLLIRAAIRNISQKTAVQNPKLKETTLTSRLLHYLKAKSSTDIVKSTLLPKYGDMKLDLNVLSRNAAHRKITFLDDKFCLDIYHMDTAATFLHLDYYMLLVPDRILEYRFYHLAIDRLNNCLEFLSTAEIVRFIFYIGLQKKTKEAQKLLCKCLRSLDERAINDLSIEDICVICHATFKASTKISNVAILEKVKSTLNENLHLMKDPALLITLIKTLRHNKYQDDDVLSTITCTVLFNSTHSLYSFAEMCHILACYADYMYYDEPILKLFNEKCVRLLKESETSPIKCYDNDYIRVKDIKRFLWAYSLLGYKLDKEVFTDVLVPKIKERIDNGDYEEDPGCLVDSILYMWILKYQAVELLQYGLCKRNVELIKERKSRSKLRLNMLLNCLQLENRELYKTLCLIPNAQNYFNVKHQLSQRPCLHRVFNVCQELSTKIDVKKFELDCQIPHLNIYGITGYKNSIYKTVFIEVLDSYVCVKNRSSFAFGPMQLKLRLLDDMEQALIIVTAEELETMNDAALEEHLSSEIQMLC